MHKTFVHLIKIELKKAIKNKFFVTTLMVGSIFALFSAWYMIDSYAAFEHQNKVYTNNGNPMIQQFSLFNHWIGGEAFSLGYTLFFTLIPLMAVLPYSWSYFIENKIGYVKSIVTRSSKFQYYLSKYIATFVSGGLVVLIPLIANILIVACFVPAITPTKLYPLYYAVDHGSLWSGLFYTHPIIYVLLYLILDFVFAGLFATMSLAVSFFIKNRIAIILIPFFFILILHYSRTFLAYIYYNEISPLHYLHSTAIENYANGGMVLTQGLLFFILTFGITMKLGVKREVF
ncbi:hypothetical protein [Amphibacillus cookii]|uniref:hypothetical protein n=1 Tax=Amphibacillus cookii TaxID=767787 RepID=UPI00195CB725|nr:hypothetical protein [Amphibacillus cookii]MBM7542280.1 hypothetical protein [Amphibacillus cookii]